MQGLDYIDCKSYFNSSIHPASYGLVVRTHTLIESSCNKVTKVSGIWDSFLLLQFCCMQWGYCSSLCTVSTAACSVRRPEHCSYCAHTAVRLHYAAGQETNYRNAFAAACSCSPNSHNILNRDKERLATGRETRELFIQKAPPPKAFVLDRKYFVF